MVMVNYSLKDQEGGRCHRKSFALTLFHLSSLLAVFFNLFKWISRLARPSKVSYLYMNVRWVEY